MPPVLNSALEARSSGRLPTIVAVSGAQTGAYGMPFAGGAGAGVSIHPMGFLVCGRNGVRLLSAGSASPMERVAELIPQALESIKKMDEDEERERPPQVQAAYRE